jgi:hypothetical protein
MDLVNDWLRACSQVLHALDDDLGTSVYSDGDFGSQPNVLTQMDVLVGGFLNILNAPLKRDENTDSWLAVSVPPSATLLDALHRQPCTDWIDASVSIAKHLAQPGIASQLRPSQFKMRRERQGL